jgi:hypothetical protein
MTPQFADRAVMEGASGGFLDGPNRSFCLVIGPQVMRFGQAVPDAEFLTGSAEGVTDPGCATA